MAHDTLIFQDCFIAQSLLGTLWADVFRIDRVPENAVRHHPTVRQVDVGAELDSHHLAIHLDNDALQPAADPFVVLFMVAIDLHRVANLKFMFDTRVAHVSKLSHRPSLRAFFWFIGTVIGIIGNGFIVTVIGSVGYGFIVAIIGSIGNGFIFVQIGNIYNRFIVVQIRIIDKRFHIILQLSFHESPAGSGRVHLQMGCVA